jgi:hypothetical protein
MDKQDRTKERKESTNKKIPVGGEIFRTQPEGPWGPPSLLYTGDRDPFPGGKAARALR